MTPIQIHTALGLCNVLHECFSLLLSRPAFFRRLRGKVQPLKSLDQGSISQWCIFETLNYGFMWGAIWWGYGGFQFEIVTFHPWHASREHTRASGTAMIRTQNSRPYLIRKTFSTSFQPPDLIWAYNCHFVIDWSVTSSLQTRSSVFALPVRHKNWLREQIGPVLWSRISGTRRFFECALCSLWKVEWGACCGGGDGEVGAGFGLGGWWGGGRLQRQFPFCSHWHDCLPPLAFMEVLNWDHLYIKIGTEKELLRLVRGKSGKKRLVICDKGFH